MQAQYYDGDFNNSFLSLQEKLPLDYLLKPNVNPSKTDKIIFYNAINIYEMEGEEWISAKKLATHDFYFKNRNLRMLFALGEINEAITFLMKKDFVFFELQVSLMKLAIEDVDLYLEKLYDKSHLERVQVSYVRSKIVPLEKSKIETLVSINPYTRGLKKLMLAFIEEDIEMAKKLYTQAIHNLKHIKYYYVEAIYFYSKFLHKHELEEFDHFYEMGLGLAKKHYYRFLQYRFEQITNPTGEEYDPKNYPLPDGVDFTEYLNQFSKKTSGR